jgi:gamma-butyrobetaine dioxygenase
VPSSNRSAAEIVHILRAGAGWTSDDEAVDELTHALQAAGRALDAGADDELVVAAALHDIGRYPTVRARFPGLEHEAAGARFCRAELGERIGWLVGAHVPAKRYLVAVDATYAAQLSPASVASLVEQGGPMSADEVVEFEKNPWAHEAAALRRWDDAAKVPGASAPTLEDLEPYIARCLRGG